MDVFRLEFLVIEARQSRKNKEEVMKGNSEMSMVEFGTYIFTTGVGFERVVIIITNYIYEEYT